MVRLQATDPRLDARSGTDRQSVLGPDCGERLHDKISLKHARMRQDRRPDRVATPPVNEQIQIEDSSSIPNRSHPPELGLDGM
jgi:hypothetical protein